MACPRPSLLGVRRAGAIAGVAASCTFGCDGAVVNLGSTAPLVVGGDSGAAGSTIAGSSAQGGSGGLREWVRSEEPLLSDQDDEEKFALANPMLPENGDYLLFTRQARGAPDPHIWKALPLADGFRKPDFANENPVPLGEDEVVGVSSPALSSDGSELWFGLGSAAARTEVYLAVGDAGEWGTPVAVNELNTTSDDSPRPPGLNGTVMPLSSKSHGDNLFQIYFAKRAGAGAPWSTPNRDLLGNINVPGATSVDGFLTADGLTLYFAFAPVDPNKADLFRARRSSSDVPFEPPQPLDGLQEPDSDERDPWLTVDGKWLYYSSNRTGLHAIYRARHVE